MTGEIHGLISREEAWRMWRPYGQRVELDGSIDPAAFTNEEALRVLRGADKDTQKEARMYWYSENDSRPWHAGLADVDLGNTPALVELFAASQKAQQKIAEQKRTQAIEGGLDFARKLGQGVMKLQQEGFLSAHQARDVETWIIAPDGLPYMQYTPMSQLEFARLALKYYQEYPSFDGSDWTDFSLGILHSTSGSYPQTTVHMQHNKVHESVHGSLSGLEIYDITREDGLRWPTATVVGTFAYEPTTEVMPNDDFSAVENVEICEGWTDFIARELIRVEPTLGAELVVAKGYVEWAKIIGEFRAKDPNIYTAITDAMLVEASSANPDRKRQALVDMHQFADRRLGAPNSLGKLFVAKGGSILDVHTKGKKRAK